MFFSLEMEELLKAVVSRQPKLSRISSAFSLMVTFMAKEGTEKHYKPSTNLDTHKIVLTEMWGFFMLRDLEYTPLTEERFSLSCFHTLK